MITLRGLFAMAAVSVTAAVSQADLNSGLVLYYSFDRNETNVVTDQSGQGHTGAVEGALYTAQGYHGGAYSFDGNASISAGDVLDVSTSTPVLTACAWVKAATNNGYVALLGKCQETWPYTGWMVGIDPPTLHEGRVYADLIANFPERTISYSLRTVLDGQWHFVCGIYKVRANGLETEIFIDGVREGSATFWEHYGSTDSAVPLTIGRRIAHGSWAYKGLIDEVRIYNRGLTASEVAALAGLRPAPEITTIGFSDTADGEQDTTVFLSDETLFCRVRDVNLSASSGTTKVYLQVSQAKKGRLKEIKQRVRLMPQADGSFLGGLPLGAFHADYASVEVVGEDKAAGHGSLLRSSYITILHAAKP